MFCVQYFNKEVVVTAINVSDQKGEVAILGAIVTLSEGIQIHITNKNDKRHSNTFTLRAKSVSEVSNLLNWPLCSLCHESCRPTTGMMH